MTTTQFLAQERTSYAVAAVSHAQTVAIDLAAFNKACEYLRTGSAKLRREFNTGDVVRVANAPKSRAGKDAVIVGWEGSCYGYSIAILRYAGVKRTYQASIFSLYNG